MYRKFQIDLLPYAEQIFDLEFIEDINFETSIGISWEFSEPITGDRETKPEPSVAENFEIDPYDCDPVELSGSAKEVKMKFHIIALTIHFFGDRIAQDIYDNEPDKFDK